MPLKQKRPVALTPEEWPRFVYFRDPKDPKTVEALLTYRDVGQAWNASRVFNKDRFAEVFGEGVALKSVTLEVTHEPVTTGVVAEFLPKFSRESPMSIPGQSLFPSDFTKSTK
jgi:hypothetical protein